MKMRNRAGMVLAAAIAAASLGGCGGSDADPAASTLPDGTYSGQSEPESDGTYGTVTFVVDSGVVTEASFVVHDADGTAHDENYGLGSDGEPADQAFYQRAQNAIEAEKQYVTQFEESGDQSDVEAIAGASLSHRLFRSAISDAILNGGQ